MGLLPLFLVGLIFIVAAEITLNFPPKKINPTYGYRTSRSMKNQENWDKAQHYSSKLMLKQGVGMLAIGGLLIAIPLSDELSAIISVALLLISVIVLFVLTEKQLK